MSQRLDYHDKKFGHLTMVAYAKSGGSGRGAIWLARCDCGNVKEVLAKDVSRGRVKSCGKCEYSRRHPAPFGTLKVPRDRRSYTKQIYKAIKEGRKWELTPEQYKQLIQEKCTICGSSEEAGGHKIAVIDEKKTYSLENSATICTGCLRIKGQLTFSEFLDKLKLIAEKGFIKDLLTFIQKQNAHK